MRGHPDDTRLQGRQRYCSTEDPYKTYKTLKLLSTTLTGALLGGRGLPHAVGVLGQDRHQVVRPRPQLPRREDALTGGHGFLPGRRASVKRGIMYIHVFCKINPRPTGDVVPPITRLLTKETNHLTQNLTTKKKMSVTFYG